MAKEHHLVIIPELGDETDLLEQTTKNWQAKYGITPYVKPFGWQGAVKSRLRILNF